MNKMLKEVDKIDDELQKISNKLDHVVEPLLSHDRIMLEKKVQELKSSDGEGWAIGEVVERIINM